MTELLFNEIFRTVYVPSALKEITMNLKQYIIEKSKELNIDIIGFTDCEPLVDIEDYLITR